MTKGGTTGDRDREVLIALEGSRAGRSMREIAEDLYGAEVMVAELGADSWVPVRTRRLLRDAERG